MRLEPLPRAFYARPVLTVARAAIGQLLVHRTREGTLVGRIVETEAYRGPEDRAAHSYGGRRTARTATMFGPPGHAYVFLVYGLHHHFNLVTGAEGEPHAVLVRAVEPLLGLELMVERRGVSAARVALTNGPGKLCEAFAIDRSHDGRDLCAGHLFLAAGSRLPVKRSARIGVGYAGTWAKRPWRYFVPADRYVSGPRSGTLHGP